MGNRDGEEGNAEPSVDQGRHPDAKDARAGENKDNGDRAEAEPKCGCDATQSIGSWCDTGGRSREEEGVKGSRRATGLYGRATGRRSRKRRGTAHGLSNWT
jgi:hypothetical protein